ncbi:MAG: ribosome-associated translation inhibitor RaiA [Spirochaetaceae bacterium]|nr:ribosome-associated translation inhibitor RaiA [Spirochaetaceae bacterium]
MTVNVKGVHYNVSETTSEYIEKRLEKLEFVEDLIVDLHIIIKKESKGFFIVESNIHFRWGQNSHIKVEERELYKAIDEIFDKMLIKVSREKEKIKQH